MVTLSLMMFFSMTISLIMISLSILTSEKSIKEREKMTPFECGFSPQKKARAPFSLRFFIITLIFIIFDMEVALVLPIGIMAMSSSTQLFSITSLMVVIILIVGLLHEWKNGALTWM